VVKSTTLAVLALILSTSVHSTVINTLNGVEYEWLELTETEGLSRSQVEAQLNDVNSLLYGYEYASRALVKSLFFSYATWDGIDGLHNSPDVVDGTSQFVTDFGYVFSTTNRLYARGFYGLTDECAIDASCHGGIDIDIDNFGVAIGGYQYASFGWSDTSTDYPIWHRDDFTGRIGSFLVKENVVPVPAAAWLFSSGLISLIGLARRKKCKLAVHQ